MTHTFKPSTETAEAEESLWVRRQPGLFQGSQVYIKRYSLKNFEKIKNKKPMWSVWTEHAADSGKGLLSG